MGKKAKTADPFDDLPTYWFAEFERSVAEGDEKRAGECQRRLRELGFNVSARPPKQEARA